jgi:hypothetical protein
MYPPSVCRVEDSEHIEQARGPKAGAPVRFYTPLFSLTYHVGANIVLNLQGCFFLSAGDPVGLTFKCYISDRARSFPREQTQFAEPRGSHRQSRP